MGVNKLTGEQILQKLEEIFDGNVYAYAYGDFLEGCPDDFEFSEETKRIREEKEKAYSNYCNADRGSEENTKLYNLWRECKNPKPLMEQEFLNSIGLGEIKEVDQYGGEGHGNTWYTIKHFVDHDVYVKTNGWYSSYEGTEFEDGFGTVVSPKKKMITVYE